MKNSDVFYFDVDGTLLDNSTSRFSKKTKEALKALKDKGYKIGICTGRTVGAVKDTELQQLADWDVYILANGGVILDADFNEVHHGVCEPEFVRELVSLYPGNILFEGEILLASGQLSDALVNFMEEAKLEHPPIVEYTDQEVQKIILDDVTLIEGGFDHPIFKDYNYNLNTDNLYEIYPKTFNKSDGIKKANDHLNTKKSTFFGDGLNDLEALRDADISVAMGNALDEVKEVAQIIAKSVSDDGVYHTLKQYKVI